MNNAYISKEDAATINVQNIIDTQILNRGKNCKRVFSINLDDMYLYKDIFDVYYDNSQNNLIIKHYYNLTNPDTYLAYVSAGEDMSEYDLWYGAPAWFVVIEDGYPVVYDAYDVDDAYIGIGECTEGYAYRDVGNGELYVTYQD